MKKLIVLLLLVGCTKEKTEICKYVGYIVDQYDYKSTYIGTYISYPFTQVCGVELLKWESISPKSERICGTNDTLRLIIKTKTN